MLTTGFGKSDFQLTIQIQSFEEYMPNGSLLPVPPDYRIHADAFFPPFEGNTKRTCPAKAEDPYTLFDPFPETMNRRLGTWFTRVHYYPWMGEPPKLRSSLFHGLIRLDSDCLVRKKKKKKKNPCHEIEKVRFHWDFDK